MERGHQRLAGGRSGGRKETLTAEGSAPSFVLRVSEIQQVFERALPPLSSPPPLAGADSLNVAPAVGLVRMTR